MMEMEMNADLDDDVESESSQSSSEGSSASSTFCALEKDYARITQEMKKNESLATFEVEYTRLFENLYKAHKTEKELSERIQTLTDELKENAEKVLELRKTKVADSAEISRLKREIDHSKRLTDAAHTRELNAQETIENLRLNVKKLTREIEQKNKQLVATEDNTGDIGKQKDVLLKEREKLLAEIEILKQQMNGAIKYTEELEKKIEIADEETARRQETIEMQLNQISKDRRARENAETKLEQLQEQLLEKDNDLEMANITVNTSAKNIAKLENQLKESEAAVEKMQKEIIKLTSKKTSLEFHLESANTQIEAHEKDLSEKEKEIKTIKHETHRLQEECSRLKCEKESSEKKATKVESERSKLLLEVKQLETSAKAVQAEGLSLRKIQHDQQQQIEMLVREKNSLARSKEALQEQAKKLSHEIGVLEAARKKMNYELDSMRRASSESRRKLETLGKERDKCNERARQFARQVEDHRDDIRVKQLEILDYKKRLAEWEAKCRQQQNLFEAIRAERNSCSKSLIEAQEEIEQLKSKLKITSHQVEQVREEVTMKEADLVKQEFLLGRVDKEKESLRSELQSRQKEITEVRAEMEEAKQELKRLRETIRRADLEISRKTKNIDEATNERDILGTQLVRRNDELGLRYNRIQVLEGILKKGELQYNQRLEDIRLLKLQVKNLSAEKALLAKSIANMSDLRREIFHVTGDLTRERLKVMALEEEIQTPINVHRWRKLEGADPDSYDLVRKVQTLQKRILKIFADSFDKDKKLRDTEKVYTNLREILSKHPGPELCIAMKKTQRALRGRGENVKCLLSEINLYETQLNEYKFDVERLNRELNDLKAKYYAQKRKLKSYAERLKERLPTGETAIPQISMGYKKFRGGGFSMSASPLPLPL